MLQIQFIFDRLIAPFQDAPPLLGTNDSNVMTFLASPLCRARAHACHSKLKFDQFKLEIQYIYKVFHAIYKKFLITIDHIDHHPSQQYTSNKSQSKKE